jgi:hypothetical protein
MQNITVKEFQEKLKKALFVSIENKTAWYIADFSTYKITGEKHNVFVDLTMKMHYRVYEISLIEENGEIQIEDDSKTAIASDSEGQPVRIRILEPAKLI